MALEAVLEEYGIPTLRGDESGTEVVAESDPFPEEPFEALLTGPGPCFLVALDRITDVGNLGSIARSAEGAGAAGLVLEHRHSAPIGPGALRASAGALEYLRVGRTPNLRRSLELAREEGFRLLVADPNGAPMYELDREELKGPLIWVFGSEDRGVRPSIREVASRIVGITTRGKLDSLGVAAAAAHVLLWTAHLRGGSGPGEG
jgi:23S rRNA (guanosine2251-2'-O)-methyltransferase